ncbi:MAG: HIT family protein [Steroidobacteraceae bacterium]
MQGTAIHVLVERCRAGDCETAIGRMPSGWAVIATRQVLPGYCLLLPDPVVPHLNALESAARDQFMSDMALIGDVLLALTGGVRINYAIFGNVEPALHAHIFPRDSAEPAVMRDQQPWALDWTAAPIYTESLYGDFKRRVSLELEKRHALK